MNGDDLSLAVYLFTWEINWVVCLNSLAGRMISDTSHYTCKAAFAVCRLLKPKSNNVVRAGGMQPDQKGRASSKGYARTLFVGVYGFWPAGVRSRRKQLLPWIKHKREMSRRPRLREREGCCSQCLKQVGTFTFSVKNHSSLSIHNRGSFPELMNRFLLLLLCIICGVIVNGLFV